MPSTIYKANTSITANCRNNIVKEVSSNLIGGPTLSAGAHYCSPDRERMCTHNSHLAPQTPVSIQTLSGRVSEAHPCSRQGLMKVRLVHHQERRAGRIKGHQSSPWRPGHTRRLRGMRQPLWGMGVFSCRAVMRSPASVSTFTARCLP